MCSGSPAWCGRPRTTPASAPSSSFKAHPPSSTARCSSAWCAPLEHMLRNAVVHGIEPPGAPRRAGQAGCGPHLGQLDARRGRGRDRGHRRRRRHQREADPREGRGPGSRRPALEAHRRGGHAAHPGAGVQHRGPRHAGGGPRRRHGRGGDRGQEARRRLVHRIDARQGHALHHPPAVHPRHQPGADRARRRGGLRAAAGHGRGRRAAAAQHRGASSRQGLAAVRIRRPEIPLPAARLVRRSRRRPVCRKPTCPCRWC